MGPWCSTHVHSPCVGVGDLSPRSRSLAVPQNPGSQDSRTQAQRPRICGVRAPPSGLEGQGQLGPRSRWGWGLDFTGNLGLPQPPHLHTSCMPRPGMSPATARHVTSKGEENRETSDPHGFITKESHGASVQPKAGLPAPPKTSGRSRQGGGPEVRAVVPCCWPTSGYGW